MNGETKEERVGGFFELQAALQKDDQVHHPKHYMRGKIEVIDFLEDQELGFHEANVVKYVTRARWKGHELEDLKKALWYLNRRIEKLMGVK